jgi:hypothetical protein
MANANNPASITFFRSKPSEIGPEISAKQAYPIAYALTIQPEILVEMPYMSAKVGSSGEIRNVSVPIKNIIKKNINEYRRIVYLL